MSYAQWAGRRLQSEIFKKQNMFHIVPPVTVSLLEASIFGSFVDPMWHHRRWPPESVGHGHLRGQGPGSNGGDGGSVEVATSLVKKQYDTSSYIFYKVGPQKSAPLAAPSPGAL